MNELSRKTVFAVMSVAFTVVVLAVILAVFWGQLWKSPDNPLGTDGVGPNNRILESATNPDLGADGR